jgi:hypothetical protein
MQPYKRKEIIGDCTLYLGNNEDILSILDSGYSLLTDPPYGIGASNYKRGGTQYGESCAPCKVYEAKEWDANPVEFSFIEKLIQLSEYSIIFGGNYYPMPPSSCWLVWDKMNGEGSGYADCELAWTNLDKAVRRIRWRWAGMLQQDMRNKEERLHPTQKPIEVMRWAIGHFPDKVETILDPYMGSGTTGVACAKMNKKFIGCEIEESYFDSACERIANAYKQPDMLLQTSIPMKQEILI